MDRREKALADLKALIRQERARIDPQVLERAAQAAKKQQPGAKQAAPATKNTGTVPYDSKTAKEAIALFLEHHSDASGFQKRLLERLKKSDH